MTKTIEERIKRMGKEWAYKQLIGAYEQMAQSSTPENLETLNRVYQRVNRLFFDQLGFNVDLQKERFFSGEIEFSSIGEIKAFARKSLEKALRIARKYMPIYVRIYRTIEKGS